VPSGVCAVLLAAGAGSRFGGSKLLAPYGGRPLIEAALSNLAGSAVDATVVVVGDGASALREVCEKYGVRVVENPDWAQGQSTSVRAGLAACGPDVRAAVVLLADQPLVGAGAVERLVEAFEEGAKVAVATYDGRPRNPVLFSREVWPLVLRELSGDEGARVFIRGHPELIEHVACDGVGDTADVDTREDLRRLERMHGREHNYKIGRRS
jgi:CTP:molybdopterin cytidylyltransferase MocA